MARTSYPTADLNPPAKRFNSLLIDLDERPIRSIAEYLVRLGDYLRRVGEVANGAMAGKTNNVLDVTWSNGATTTTITDTRISPNSFVDFTPKTANAADMWRDGGWYISARDKGTLTITHTAFAQSDLDFVMVIIG